MDGCSTWELARRDDGDSQSPWYAEDVLWLNAVVLDLAH